jgi:hypothetical protein
MYKVRAHRTDEGGYTLEYGKGQKKIVHRLVKHGNAWRFIEAPQALLGKFALLDDAKQAFETWAGNAYGGPVEDNPLVDSPVSDKGTILEARNRFGPPPPMTGRDPDPASQEISPDGLLTRNTDFQGDYDTPDPFDPENFEKIDGYTHITTLGALRHVWNWVNNRYCMKGKYDEIPTPFESVRRRLARLEPNNLDYQLPSPARRKN